uniref:Chromo domain-containing protein n=1 Tax=viral metagenome TaxID=1070528 RepID=A0A6C0BM97_9ZZZZ
MPTYAAKGTEATVHSSKIAMASTPYVGQVIHLGDTQHVVTEANLNDADWLMLFREQYQAFTGRQLRKRNKPSVSKQPKKKKKVKTKQRKKKQVATKSKDERQRYLKYCRQLDIDQKAEASLKSYINYRQTHGPRSFYVTSILTYDSRHVPLDLKHLDYYGMVKYAKKPKPADEFFQPEKIRAYDPHTHRVLVKWVGHEESEWCSAADFDPRDLPQPPSMQPTGPANRKPPQ